jgi:hypothetical protein
VITTLIAQFPRDESTKFHSRISRVSTGKIGPERFHQQYEGYCFRRNSSVADNVIQISLICLYFEGKNLQDSDDGIRDLKGILVSTTVTMQVSIK